MVRTRESDNSEIELDKDIKLDMESEEENKEAEEKMAAKQVPVQLITENQLINLKLDKILEILSQE